MTKHNRIEAVLILIAAALVAVIVDMIILAELPYPWAGLVLVSAAGLIAIGALIALYAGEHED